MGAGRISGQPPGKESDRILPGPAKNTQAQKLRSYIVQQNLDALTGTREEALRRALDFARLIPHRLGPAHYGPETQNYIEYLKLSLQDCETARENGYGDGKPSGFGYRQACAAREALCGLDICLGPDMGTGGNNTAYIQ